MCHTFVLLDMELDREMLVSRSPIRYSETLLKERTKITHVEADLLARQEIHCLY